MKSPSGYYEWLFWDFLSELREDVPRFHLHVKENSRLMGVMGWFYKNILRTKPAVWRNATVSLGRHVWMPRKLIGTKLGYETMRHEACHVHDYHNHKWFYILTYFILPYGPSFRAIWEYRGYRESLKVIAEDKGFISNQDIEMVISAFTNCAYGMMFPFPKLLRKWFRQAREEIYAELDEEMMDEAMEDEMADLLEEAVSN